MEPPGPRLPRGLQTLLWLMNSPKVMERSRSRYGDVFRVNLMARAITGPGAAADEGSWVFLADPDDVKRVFTAGADAALTGVTNRWLEPLVGSHSILVLDGPAHLARRKLMLPPLHGDRVRRYGELMHDVATAHLERWPRGEPIALWPRMQAITLEVIARVVFGVTQPEALTRVQQLLGEMLNRMTSRRWLVTQALRASLAASARGDARDTRHGRRLVAPVEQLLYDEIRRRRQADDLEGRDDILSTLIRARYEDGAAMNDDELRDQLMTLLIAGHESTATELSWAFERLVRQPEMLERLRDDDPSADDAYADAVVKETLRLRPVLAFVLRKLMQPMTLGGFPLPAGTWVAPCAYLIHRREDVYPEPHRFRPERFLERSAGTYTWMPFGGGIRRCLGASFAQLEMKQVLRAVTSSVELRPARPEGERIASRFVTLAPSRGATVVLGRSLSRPRGPVRAAQAMPT